MGNMNLVINGVNTNASRFVKIDKESVTQDQVQAAAKDNGLDEIMVMDQESGQAYIAYGTDMNFSGLDGYQAGDRVNATLNGKQVALVPFVNQTTSLLYDDEMNSARDGSNTAISVTKNVGLKVFGMAKDNALEIASAGMTLGAFARMGGAKVTTTAGQSFMSKAGTWAFGPAKEMTGQAFKGFGKVAKWGAIIAAGAAVVGYGGTVAYGASKNGKGNAAALEALAQKDK